ncbi:MAG: ATPase [Bacteroidetes bacterium]|nr:MAG: ATPase [Bacteroidota bacterium]
MKTTITSLLCCFIFCGSVFAQSKSATETDTIKVYGNCGMCKATIEGALKRKEGIISKNWNKVTKMLVVTYDPSKIKINQIGAKIAEVGYDNQYATAKEETYNKLHSCCHYERPKKDK